MKQNGIQGHAASECPEQGMKPKSKESLSLEV